MTSKYAQYIKKYTKYSVYYTLYTNETRIQSEVSQTYQGGSAPPFVQ